MPGLRRLVVTTRGVVAVIEDSVSARGPAGQRRNRSAGWLGAAGLGQAFPAAFALSSDHRWPPVWETAEQNHPASVIEVWDLQTSKLAVG